MATDRTVRCLTWPLEVEQGLTSHTGSTKCRLDLEFEVRDAVVRRVVTVLDSTSRDDGSRHLLLMTESGNTFTIALPAPITAENTHLWMRGTDIVDMPTSTERALTRSGQSLDDLALEEYMRWVAARLAGFNKTAPDGGPYADNPRLYRVPREVREAIANKLADDKIVGAAKALFDHDRSLGLAQVATIIKALRL